MSIFKYTLPSGKEFEVQGPPGATQEQADRIFYTQVASGSLVDYTPGQTLTSTELALAKFNLSRLDRGTAGVEDTVVLSIVQGLPIVAPIPDLFNTPIVDPITQSDIALIGQDQLGPPAIGVLTADEVAGLMAQLIRLVAQDYTIASNEKGVGKYGFSAEQLERAGYVKPNTYNIYIKPNPSLFLAVLSSPSVWTGLNGVTGLDIILADEARQNLIQIELMQLGYQGLTAAGIIQPPATPAQEVLVGEIYRDNSVVATTATNITNLVTQNSAALINIAAKYGPQIADAWSRGLSPSTLTPNLDILGKASQFAASFASGITGTLTSGVRQAAGYVNTVNRATVDAAVTRIIGNPKVPPPVYAGPGSATAQNQLDINQAQSILTTAVRQGQQVLTLAQNLRNQGTAVTNRFF